MRTELSFDGAVDNSDCFIEHDLVELRNHLSRTESTEGSTWDEIRSEKVRSMCHEKKANGVEYRLVMQFAYIEAYFISSIQW